MSSNGSNSNSGHRPSGGGDAALRVRMQELLIDRATTGLPAHEEAELELIADRLRIAVDDGFERAAAATDLALNAGTIKATPALPEALRQRILASGQMWSRQQRTADDEAMQPRDSKKLTLVGLDDGVRSRRPERTGVLGNARAWGGWVAAAACLAFAINTKYNAPAGSGGGGVIADGGSFEASPLQGADATRSLLAMIRTKSAREARAEIVRAAFKDSTDVITVPILASASFSPDAVSVPQALGDVVWSGESQKGMLHLTALSPIATPGDVYQLWVVDALRDEKYPVSAGTFRVSETEPVTLVPFTPAVKVGYASRFMITIERNGGVVVTSGEDVTAVAPATTMNSASDSGEGLKIEAGGPSLMESAASERANDK
ncbi:MAG: anti-sigma factor [Phycisphaerales bacterium]|nr:anti-sigma factor [Phycisphaerales bacterium]